MSRADKDRGQHPWSRLAAETSTAYAAFLAYRDMGIKRSIDKAWAAYRAKTGNAGATNQPSGQFCAQSSRFRWSERARAWDDHLAAERDRVAAAEARKWERRRQASLEDNYQVAQQIREKLRAMLKWPISRTRTEDGLTIIEPARWNFMTVARLAMMVAELETATYNAIAADVDEMTDVEVGAVAGLHDEPQGPRLAGG